MSTSFFDLNLLEQNNDTQQYNFVKGIKDSFNFNNTIWVQSAQIFPSLNPLVLPVLPTLFAYIKNIGSLNIGIEITPFAPPLIPGLTAQTITLLAPGGVFLLSSPNLAGAVMITPGGPFPNNVTGGIQGIFLEASSDNPSAFGLVEYFLGG